MTTISRLLKIYNMVLIPLVITLFILLYVSIRAGNEYAVYFTTMLVILSPFIAYLVTRRMARI